MYTKKLTYREILDVVLATLRAHRRFNERLISDYRMYDVLFSFLNEHNIEYSDAIRNTIIGDLDLVGGQNAVDPRMADVVREILRETELPVSIAEIAEKKSGKIFFNASGIALNISYYQDHPVDAVFPSELNRKEGESAVRFVQRWTLMTMCHERRHSCQDYMENLAEYASIDPNGDVAMQYHSLPCEVDADSFGAFHTTDPNGMYTNAF